MVHIYIYICICIKWCKSRSVVSNFFQPHGWYNPWNSPGQNTGVGSLSLLQWIFPTRGLTPGLLYCRRILYQLSHKESPRILEWVAYPFSSGSSRPRSRTGVSWITGDLTELSGKHWKWLCLLTWSLTDAAVWLKEAPVWFDSDMTSCLPENCWCKRIMTWFRIH